MTEKKHQTTDRVVNLLRCLGILEDKTCFLYKILSEKVEDISLKLKFHFLSNDSEKHSSSLNGIIEKNTFRAYFLMDCQKTFKEGGIYSFDMGEYIKIIK